MSDELRLPDDLAACEARLAAQPLPGSRLDRDQLMYRAGWAACESRLVVPNPPPSKVEEGPGRRGARGGITAAWSFASAAVAASIAVTITLQLQLPSQMPLASVSDAQRPQQASVPRGQIAQPSENRRPANESNGGLANFALFTQPRSLAPSSAPLFWAARSQTLPGAGDATIYQVAALRGPGAAGPTEAAKTARQLLNEYLPASSADANPQGKLPRIRFDWLWNPPRSGETI
jgi:hypothetical protein